jgi:hypothetical protein
LGGRHAGSDRGLRVERAEIITGEEHPARAARQRSLQPAAAGEAVGRAERPTLDASLDDLPREAGQNLVEIAEIGPHDLVVIEFEELTPQVGR